MSLYESVVAFEVAGWRSCSTAPLFAPRQQAQRTHHALVGALAALREQWGRLPADDARFEAFEQQMDHILALGRQQGGGEGNARATDQSAGLMGAMMTFPDPDECWLRQIPQDKER